jgi:hypothetical protein
MSITSGNSKKRRNTIKNDLTAHNSLRLTQQSLSTIKKQKARTNFKTNSNKKFSNHEYYYNVNMKWIHFMSITYSHKTLKGDRCLNISLVIATLQHLDSLPFLYLLRPEGDELWPKHVATESI